MVKVDSMEILGANDIENEIITQKHIEDAVKIRKLEKKIELLNIKYKAVLQEIFGPTYSIQRILDYSQE
jgi:hypothetical protein